MSTQLVCVKNVFLIKLIHLTILAVIRQLALMIDVHRKTIYRIYPHNLSTQPA